MGLQCAQIATVDITNGGIPWLQAVDSTASFHATRHVGTWGARRVSAATVATLPVDLTVQLRPASATKLDPLQISRTEEEACCVHASILFTLDGFSPINRRP